MEVIKILNRRKRKLKEKLRECRNKLSYSIKPKREITNEKYDRLVVLAHHLDLSVKKLKNFTGFINSDDYTSGTFISRESLLRRLRITTNENYSLQVSFMSDVVEIDKNISTTIDFVPMQKEEVRSKNLQNL